MGDVHHIFPREYLKKNGYNVCSQYNQVANYAYLDTRVNISIGQKAPNDYFSIAFNQCETGNTLIGTITNKDKIKENLSVNCIPDTIVKMTADNYPEILRQRRLMIAIKIKNYYNIL